MIGRIRVGYSERTLNRIIGRLSRLPLYASIDDIKGEKLDKRKLIQTLRHNSVEFNDAAIKWRQNTPTIGELSSCSEADAKKLYSGLADTVKALESHSEPYVSAVRLALEVFSRDLHSQLLALNLRDDYYGLIGSAQLYSGKRFTFNEKDGRIEAHGNRISLDDFIPKQKASSSRDEIVKSVCARVSNIKNLLNMLEDATDSEMYKDVSNTNEFPEFRTRASLMSFGYIAQEIRMLRKEYKELARYIPLGKNEGLELFKKSRPGIGTRISQEYAELQKKYSAVLNPVGAVLLLTSSIGAMIGLTSQYWGYTVPNFINWATSWECSVATGPAGFVMLSWGPNTIRKLRDATIGTYREE